MTNDGANTLTYDAENHAVAAAGATYTYDGNSLRVKKVSGGTTTVYIFSGSKVVAEFVNGAAPSAPTREYVYSGSTLLAKIEAGVTNYYHLDHLSARVITDSSGISIGQRAHYPYGETWYETGTTTKIKFTSYERDSESGNDFAMMRYHVNRLGRFNSPDLLSGSAGDPQSLNRYAYVVDDPLNLVDPTGMFYGPCGPFDELWPPSPGGGRSGGGGIGGRQTKSLNAPPVGIDDGGGGNSSPSPTWAAIKTFFTLPSTGPGSCLAVFSNSVQGSVGSAAKSLATNVQKYGPALASGLAGSGVTAAQAQEVVAAMVAGGQLSPAVGAVTTNVITGTAPLAEAAAPYVVQIGGATALGLFDAALLKGVHDEASAALKGQCKP